MTDKSKSRVPFVIASIASTAAFIYIGFVTSLLAASPRIVGLGWIAAFFVALFCFGIVYYIAGCIAKSR